MPQKINTGMCIDVAAADRNTCLLMEHASTYMLAKGVGDKAVGHVAATTALNMVRKIFTGGADDKAQDDDPRVDHYDVLAKFLLSMLVCNDLLRDAGGPEMPLGASFAGLAVRGPLLYIAQAGAAGAYRLDRRGFAELGGTRTAALGHTAKLTARPYVETWEPGNIVMLADESITSVLDTKTIARTLLESGSLKAAAEQLVERATAGEGPGWNRSSIVLVRWTH